MHKCGLRENELHIDLKRGMRYSPYAQVFAVFRELNALSGVAFVLVSHDPDLAAQLDRTLRLQDGVLSAA